MKQSLTYIALFFLFSVLLACEKQQNRHIQVYGTVRDSLDNPVNEVPVEIKANKQWSGVLLSVFSTRTKQDGTYEVNTYLPKGVQLPSIEITPRGIGPTGSPFILVFIVEADGSLFASSRAPLDFGKPQKVDFVLK